MDCSYSSRAPSRPLPLSHPPKPAWSNPSPSVGYQPPHICQTQGRNPLPLYRDQPVFGYSLSPSHYFPHVPLNPVRPPPLPMDPENPRFLSFSPIRTRGSRARRIPPSSGGPPKAILGGPGGRPFGESVPAPSGDCVVQMPSSARADSPRATEWNGRSVVVNLPVEPYKTTWDLMREDWVAKRRLVAEDAGPEDIPLPLSPLPKGTIWPTRTPIFDEVDEPAANGHPAESLQTVDPMEVRAVSESGMIQGRCEVRIPDNTAWLVLIQDAADRVTHREDLQGARKEQGIFRRSEPVDNTNTADGLEIAHDGRRPGHGSIAPPAPSLTALRSLSDESSLVHPSPTRSQYLFHQLTSFTRKSSAEHSPNPSPLALPESRTTRSKSPVRQLFKAAASQIRDQPACIPFETVEHRPFRQHSQAGHSSVLSINAPPFVPRGDSTMPAIRPVTLWKQAAAYLPLRAKHGHPGVPNAPPVVSFDTLERPQEFTFPSVYQRVGPQITPVIKRNSTGTATTFEQLRVAKEDPTQVFSPHSRCASIISENDQRRESFCTEESDTVLCSQKPVRWAVPVHVDVTPNQCRQHYDRHKGFDRRSFGEFSNPSDEEDYLRHHSHQPAFREARQWSSSSPGESLSSPDSLGVLQKSRTKRNADDGAESLSQNEGDARRKARLKHRVHAGRVRGGNGHRAPAENAPGPFGSNVEACTVLNPLAKPFTFGAPQPFSFRSSLPSHVSRLNTGLLEPTVTAKEVSTCASKTQTPTGTCFAVDGGPVHAKRTRHTDSAEWNLRSATPLSETPVRNQGQDVAQGSRHTAPAGTADTCSLEAIEHEQEGVLRTVANGLVEAGSLFAEGDDAPCLRTCTPLSAAVIAPTPGASTRSPSPLPVWAPAKAAEEREVQKDIMLHWRFPVPPGVAGESLATSSESQPLSERQGNEECSGYSQMLAPTDVSKRTRMPLPSFEGNFCPAGVPCDKVDERSHNDWSVNSEASLARISGKSHLCRPQDSASVTGTTASPKSARPGTDNIEGNFQRETGLVHHKGISSSRTVSAGGDRAERSKAAVDGSQNTEDERRQKAFMMAEFEASMASCIKTSLEEALKGLKLTGNDSRVDQFMERIADVLEQQSQLLLEATTYQRAHEVSDEYPQEKTHTEELLDALITEQHTLLERIGNMQYLRELLERTPAAISRAAEALGVAHQATADKEALLTSLQNTRAENLTYREETGEQLAKLRMAHGQIRSELGFSQNRLLEVRVERDGLRQDLGAIVIEMSDLQDTYRKTSLELASTTSALLVIGSEKDALVAELTQMKQTVLDQHAELNRLRGKLKDGGAVMEGVAGTVASLANPVSSDATAALEFRQKTTDYLEMITRAILASQEARESPKSPDPSISEQVRELRDENTTLQIRLEQATAHANEMLTQRAGLSERLSATQKQVEEREKAIHTLQRDLQTSRLEVQRQQQAAQDALVEAARSDGDIQAYKARECATRQHYGALHRWAEECRRALERSEAMRSQPFLVRDPYTGDYAEVVTRWNRDEELTSKLSDTRSFTASTEKNQTPPRVIVKSRSLPNATNALTSPTVALKGRVASSFQQTRPTPGEVVGDGSIRLSEDGWWRKE